MRVQKSFWLIGLCIMLLGLLLIPLPVFAGTLLGSSFPIAQDSLEEVHPAIAYNTQRGEYLVVWHNERAVYPDIQAQRLNMNGAPIGGPFYIDAGTDAERRYPDVAYNPSADQYLVVWEGVDSSLPYNTISACRVSGTGAVLDDPEIILSGPSNLYTPTRPAVAYASTADRYLVVWAEDSHVGLPLQDAIYGQVMKDDGTTDGLAFKISEGTETRKNPDLAYNRHANRYLVVWEQDNGIWDIMGRQVHGGGGVWGASDTNYAYYTIDSKKPAVAAIPTSPTTIKFLLVWEVSYTASDHDICGRKVNEDGTIAGDANPSILWGVDETDPAIAANEQAQSYFVVWHARMGIMDNPIKGKLFNSQGVKQGGVLTFSGVAAAFPAVSSGDLGDFLTSWQDQPISITHDNIYGQLYGNRQFLPIETK
jgi:hypothetical protein